MSPELTLEDGIWSTLVTMVIPFNVSDTALVPTFRPITVIITAVLAAIVWVAVVMMMWVLVGVAAEPVGPPPLIDTPGDPLLAKKSVGYVNVMVLLVASAPPAVVVNENVAAADALPAMRSDVAIANEVLVT